MKHFIFEHPTLMLLTQEHFNDLSRFGLDPAPTLPAPLVSFLTFMSPQEAKAAKEQIEAAKTPGVTVVALFKE